MKNFKFRRFKAITLVALGLLSTSTIFSQDLKITPTSRMLLDAATYSDKNVDLTEGVVMRDFRMGLKASYQNFALKAEVSFVTNKVSIKDVWGQYNYKPNGMVKVGYYTPAYGYNFVYGTSYKEFLAEPAANVLGTSRRIGISHGLWNKYIWLQYGIFADNKAMSESTDVSGKQGYTVAERFVVKAVNTDDYLLQAGFSFAHVQAEANGKDEGRNFTYKVPYLTSVDKTNAINAVIDDPRYENKYSVELTAKYKFVALESQYYNSNIKRTDKPSFKSDGLYVIAKGLLLNRANYKYNDSMAGLAVPSNKALELALGYGFLDMNSRKTGIYGGKMEDFNAGLSFYWNKYITVRTNYSYITVKTKSEDPKKTVNAFQFRVQYYF